MNIALATFALFAALNEIICPGEYGGHVQGITTDPARNIYWSFTVALTKTDAEGRHLQTMDVPSHHGDLVWVDGKVYVAVNLGAFNQEAGKANSWIYVYDAESLELLDKHTLPELVHGAGGIAYNEGVFVVVGGLPKGHDRNYAYLYDASFAYLERRDLLSGYTNMGIQTACYLDGGFWFGTYNGANSLLRADDELNHQGQHDLNGAYGLAEWSDGHWLRVVSAKGSERGKWIARAIVEKPPVEP